MPRCSPGIHYPAADEGPAHPKCRVSPETCQTMWTVLSLTLSRSDFVMKHDTALETNKEWKTKYLTEF